MRRQLKQTMKKVVYASFRVNLMECIKSAYMIYKSAVIAYCRDLNYSDLILTVQIFSLCKDERTDFI